MRSVNDSDGSGLFEWLLDGEASDAPRSTCTVTTPTVDGLSVAGSVDVRYRGQPEVETSLVGSGAVELMGD